MEYVTLALKVIIAFGIFNVWIVRFSKASKFRGGAAKNMKEEFAVYGLPSWMVTVVGGLKLILAALLFLGIWYPVLVAPAAYGIGLLMLGAILMHLKVGDPIVKSLPALAMLVMSALLIWM